MRFYRTGFKDVGRIITGTASPCSRSVNWPASASSFFLPSCRLGTIMEYNDDCSSRNTPKIFSEAVYFRKCTIIWRHNFVIYTAEPELKFETNNIPGARDRPYTFR